jgi:hypothetical protein
VSSQQVPYIFIAILMPIQTVSAIYSFFLAMTLHPEVQRKAQEEIDRVVGNDRLPSFADRQQLPYVDAIAKEVFRWNAVAPNGCFFMLRDAKSLMKLKAFHIVRLRTTRTETTSYRKGH